MFLQISCYEYKYILDKNLFDKTVEEIFEFAYCAFRFGISRLSD
jgi:hypothetical protein